MLSWQNITVQQFQAVYALTENRALNEMDRLEKVIAILFDKTERQVEEMTVAEFTNRSKQCSFLLQVSEIPGKAVRRIKVNGRRYRIEYNPQKLIRHMRHRQYVESMHFGEKLIENLHYFMASLVQPLTCFGLVRRNNTSDRHADIAEDMLQARFIDLYHTGVFFCKLYTSSMQVIKGYLKQELTAKKIAPEQITLLESSLQSATDGFTALHR